MRVNRTFWWVLFVSGLPGAAFAQTSLAVVSVSHELRASACSIEGRVQDARTGMPITQATIEFSSVNREPSGVVFNEHGFAEQVAVGEGGKYAAEVRPEAVTQVVASAPGYQPVVIAIAGCARVDLLLVADDPEIPFHLRR